MSPRRGRLRAVLRPAPTAIVVVVPEAEPAVQLAGGDPRVPPHITILWPFLRRPRRRDLQTLTEVAAATEAFRVDLTHVDRFPDVLFLAPEPSHPLLALTEAVQARWPQHPPYAGAFATVVPHLTLCHTGVAPAELVAAVTALLPVAVEVTELQLVRPDPGGWRRLARAPLRPASST